MHSHSDLNFLRDNRCDLHGKGFAQNAVFVVCDFSLYSLREMVVFPMSKWKCFFSLTADAVGFDLCLVVKF